MNFYQLLVLFLLAIFLIVSLISYQSRKDQEIGERWLRLPGFNVYLSMFFVILLLSGYYILIGVRTELWFALFSLYMILSFFYARSELRSQRNLATVSIVILSIVLSSIPFLQNQGVIFGPDQWRDLEVTTYIVNEGSFEGTLRSGYYSFIPLFNVINTVLTRITGLLPMNTFFVMQVVYSTIAILSIYLVVEKVSGGRKTAFIAIAIFLSTPRLTTIQAIPAVASISLGALLILFMMELKTSLLYIVPLVSFTTTVIHPIGVIPIMSVIIGIIVLGNIITRYKVPIQTESYLRLMFTIVLLVTLVYWSIDTRVLMGVFNPLRRLLNIVVTLEYSPSVYTPQYFESEFLIYSYAWALPVAITAVYILKFLLFERTSTLQRRELVSNFHISSAFIAFLLVIIAFFSILLSPGASLERYINVPAYLLMIFPTALILSDIISSRNKTFISIGLILLMVNIFIGTSSPNWAPFENPTFGALRSTHFGYVEAQDIVTILPDGIRVYEDNDLPVVAIANLYMKNVRSDKSYQTIRKAIQDLKSNSIDLANARYRSSIFLIKTKEVIDESLYQSTINVVYNNGRITSYVFSNVT